MKIKSIHLQNFRKFENQEIRFSDEQFTVLIGNNGTGKTAFLDAISVALGGFLSGFDEVKKTRHFHIDEARIEKFRSGNFETIFPVEVSCVAEIGHQEVVWTRSLGGKKNRTSRVKPVEILNHTKELQNEVRADADVILPIVAYYGTGRLWAQRRERTVDLFESGSRFLGYTDCLDPNSDEKLFTKWFKKWVLIELQEREEQEILIAVRHAIETCLKNLNSDEHEKGSVKIEYNLKSDEIQVTLEDGKTLPFGMLSDGYRNMIGMVADIAYRMAILNPNLGADATKLTPGVVLIDEIDMHLHPKWQRSIVQDLKNTFPDVQFIVTTHSPFIIQSLASEELRILDPISADDDLIGVPQVDDDFYNMSIEDVAENVMGIDMVQWNH